jgi:hypothetical protein
MNFTKSSSPSYMKNMKVLARTFFGVVAGYILKKSL